MWKRMMQRTQIPRKRKITNRAPAPPLAKKRGKGQGQGQQRKQRKLQPRVQNQSISSSAQLHLLDDKGQEGVIRTTAASSSSSLFLHHRNSAVSSNAFHSTSDSTLIEQEEFQAAEEDASHSRTRKKNINLKSSREAVQVQVLPRKGPLLEAKLVSNSENSCLEAAVATTSVQLSCSCRNSTARREGEKHNSLQVYSEARIYTSESPDQPKTWKKDFGQSFVYSEELSCADSVFDAEIQTALSKLDHDDSDEEQAAASSCIAADVTPSFFLDSSESEEASTDQFLTVVTDDLPADYGAVRPSASSCYPLIAEFEEKFWSWSDYVSAKGSSGLTELPLTITDLECGEYTESRCGNEVFSDYLQDYICTEDEDEDTFRKFKARERKEPPFQGHLLDSINTQLTDAIGKQRLLMVNWIMEYTASYQLQWETLFLSTNLLDRFLAKGAFKNDRHIQVLGVACMTLAIRIEENQPTNCIRQQTFTVEDNVFKRQEIVAMEWIVLKVLDYQCSSPTTATFLWYYLKAAGGDAEVEKTAKYLACLSLVDRQLLRFWPSTIAASLVVLTCQVLNNSQVSRLSMMQEKLGMDGDEDMAECVLMLKWLLENVW